VAIKHHDNGLYTNVARNQPIGASQRAQLLTHRCPLATCSRDPWAFGVITSSGSTTAAHVHG